MTHVISEEELKKLGYSSVENDYEVSSWLRYGFIITSISYCVIALIDPLFTCYILPFLLGATIPFVVEFVSLNKNKWIYIIVGFLTVFSVFIMQYLNIIFYPALLVLISLPIIFKDFFGVLYTKIAKYFK